jgi:hypothetical protein
MKRPCGNLESCHRRDSQTVLPQQTLKPEHLQAEYGMNGEKGRTGAAKRLWEIVRRLWELVRLYWHTGSTPAPNSYCTPTHSQPTSLSAKEIPLDQCWAVLTSLRTGRFQFLHYFMKTWSLFQSIYIFGLVRTKEVLKILFCPNSTASQIWWFWHNRFKHSGFHSFCKLLFPYYFYLNPRPVPWRQRKIVVRPFVIPWWEDFLSLSYNTLFVTGKKLKKL